MPEPERDLEVFMSLHASMLIFTGKKHKSFRISCFHFASALFCTQLMWFLGLLKIFMWFTPDTSILGGGKG